MTQLEDMRPPAGAREALVNDPNFLRQLVEAALNRFLDTGITEHLNVRDDAKTPNLYLDAVEVGPVLQVDKACFDVTYRVWASAGGVFAERDAQKDPTNTGYRSCSS